MKRMMMTVTLAAITALASGCGGDMFGPRAQGAPAPAPAPDGNYLSKTTVRGGPDSAGAVDAALDWQKKYQDASDKLTKAQQERAELDTQQRQLLTQVTKLQQELDRSEKELADTNAMMVEMKGELDKWKGNVLGFRQEMLKGQEAQLQAIRKILEVLGAETMQAPATTQPAETSTASADALR